MTVPVQGFGRVAHAVDQVGAETLRGRRLERVHVPAAAEEKQGYRRGRNQRGGYSRGGECFMYRAATETKRDTGGGRGRSGGYRAGVKGQLHHGLASVNRRNTGGVQSG
eukprot:scaffold13797_cov102-Isochrysis_galbana.AAC.2